MTEEQKEIVYRVIPIIEPIFAKALSLLNLQGVRYRFLYPNQEDQLHDKMHS